MMLQDGSPSTFPRIVRGRVEYLKLNDECDYLLDALLLNTTFDFSFGRLYTFLHRRFNQREIVEAADDIFGQAMRLAHERGASFQLVFLPLPAECQRQEYLVDLSSLETPFVSLLEFCPSDQRQIEALRFPTDSHWSPSGNQWAAKALYEALNRMRN